FFILQTHYRSPLDFSDERLRDAAAGLARLKTANDNANELLKNEGGEGESAAELKKTTHEAHEKFYEAMADDFNTALAISYLFEAAKNMNVYYNDIVNKGAALDRENLAAAKADFDDMAEIIGILEDKAESGSSDEDAKIDALVNERLAARKAKNWARADEIRDMLKAQGIVLEDSASGTRWKRA
ncbi:MAG: DALR domain-containing protein, partial [Selenomonadaceae bacterium]